MFFSTNASIKTKNKKKGRRLEPKAHNNINKESCSIGLFPSWDSLFFLLYSIFKPSKIRTYIGEPTWNP